jgi:hypothetical protein
MPEGYPPWRTHRTLFADAAFDPSLPSPITYLHLAQEVTVDGVLPALVLEAHKTVGLQTEHLKTGDWIDCEYTSFWPHQIPDPEHAVGVYVPRFVVRLIWDMSTPAPIPLRTPPPQPAFWGEFEKLCYSQLLHLVKGF